MSTNRLSSRLSSLLHSKQRIEPDTETLHDSESGHSTSESEEEQYTFIDSWRQSKKKSVKDENKSCGDVSKPKIMDNTEDLLKLPDLGIPSAKEYLLLATTSTVQDPANYFNNLVKELGEVFDLRKNLIDEINLEFFGNNHH